MGSLIGSITGATGAAKRAAEAQRAAGDMAQYKPWDVRGSYYGDADFDYEKNEASYNLSPELTELRDLFMNKSLEGVDENSIAQGEFLKQTGYDMFNTALNTDITDEATNYYSDLQDIMAPGRAKNEQRLANNLFSSGRMGQGSAVFEETGGYVNPERLEYLTGLNRENNRLGIESYDKARAQRYEDMSKGIGYYGTGNDLRLQPYSDVSSLFGLGAGIEDTGMVPFKLGMGLGSAAQPGDQARAGAYMGAAQTRLNSDQNNIGMFTNLIGQGAQFGMNGGFSSLMSGGGGGYTGGGTFMPSSAGFNGSPHLRSSY